MTARAMRSTGFNQLRDTDDSILTQISCALNWSGIRRMTRNISPVRFDCPLWL